MIVVFFTLIGIVEKGVRLNLKTFLHLLGFGCLCFILSKSYIALWQIFLNWEIAHGGVFALTEIFASCKWNDFWNNKHFCRKLFSEENG